MPVDHKAEERAKLTRALADFDDGVEERHTQTNYPTQEFIRAQLLYGIFGDPAPGGWDSGYFDHKSQKLAAIMWSADRKEKQNAREQFVAALYSGDPMQRPGWMYGGALPSMDDQEKEKKVLWGRRDKRTPEP
jgi:hypothetical protein